MQKKKKKKYLSQPNVFKSCIKLLLKILEFLEAQGIKIFSHEMPIKISMVFDNFFTKTCVVLIFYKNK